MRLGVAAACCMALAMFMLCCAWSMLSCTGSAAFARAPARRCGGWAPDRCCWLAVCLSVDFSSREREARALSDPSCAVGRSGVRRGMVWLAISFCICSKSSSCCSDTLFLSCALVVEFFWGSVICTCAMKLGRTGCRAVSCAGHCSEGGATGQSTSAGEGPRVVHGGLERCAIPRMRIGAPGGHMQGSARGREL